MGSHALLSPSSASRWLTCTPSARLEEQFPNLSNTAADEGTLAHALGELQIKYKAKMISNITFEKERKAIESNPLFNDAMFEHMDNYSAFVLEQFYEAQARTKDALLFIEERLDMTEYVPEGFGTGDVIIIADHVLDFIDLKYGKGVPVSAVNNKQMMLYALGALHAYGFMYDVKKVRMTIYQPRLDNISEFEMTVEELYDWAHNELKPKAALAFKGLGEYAPGDTCRFCRAKAVCRANADYNLELMEYEFREPELLTDEEVAQILGKTDNLVKWVNAISEYALMEAVNNGKSYPGYKLVEGRSVRAYTDTESIVKVLTTDAHYGFDEITEPAKLLGITKLEKVIGKSPFEKYVSPYVIKPAGKPTLVPVSDKRPEFNGTASAIADFAELTEIQD